MISFNDFIAIGGFILGLLTSLSGFLVWYGSSVKKSYAAERDFNHLRRNYEQLAEGQKIILLSLDKMGEDIEAIRYQVIDKDKDSK